MSVPSSFARINLEQSRKRAKDLVKAFRAADGEAFDSVRWNHPRFRGYTDDQIRRGRFTLRDAQLVVARLHHFDNWRALLDYIESVNRSDPLVARFEAAADAIVNGDIGALRVMLDEHPSLVRERSTRAHQSTLLHYVSANGVEDYRQVTPDNILDVTRLLLDSGAEVDATSKAYGGGSTTLGLTSTSAHPRAKGVQISLIDLLLERGARVDGEGGRDLHNLVRNALANGCPEAANHLASRGARVATLYAAAGIGDMNRVQSLFAASTRQQREAALIVAAQQGYVEIARFLLDGGVDVSASDGMTALHQASAGGHLEMMDLLTARGAELEKENAFGGTVLSSTIWFAHHVTDEEFARRNYPAVIDKLIAAGARTDAYPRLQADIESVKARFHKLMGFGRSL